MLHRIPSKTNKEALPILMQHGLLSSAFSWTLETPHKTPGKQRRNTSIILQLNSIFLCFLAFLMADAGFDVWLTNVRGSHYSRNHTYFPIQSKEFWDFRSVLWMKIYILWFILFIVGMKWLNMMYQHSLITY